MKPAYITTPPYFPNIFLKLLKKLGCGATGGGGGADMGPAPRAYLPGARPSNWLRMSKTHLRASCSAAESSGWKKSMMRT